MKLVNERRRKESLFCPCNALVPGSGEEWLTFQPGSRLLQQCLLMEHRGYRWTDPNQPQAWCWALPLLNNRFLGLQKNTFLGRNDLQGMVKIRKLMSLWLLVHKLITYINRTNALISFWSYLHIYWGLQCLVLWHPTDLKVKTHQVSLRFTSNSGVRPRGGTKWQNSALLWNY